MKNDATLPALAKKHGVHPTQLKTWEKIMREKGSSVFIKKENSYDDQHDYIAALERKTGQLALENDFLKKNLNKYPKGND
jgi:transposase